MFIADVFHSFKDETGDFKACLVEDIQGIMCLYEASYLSVEGENILERARDFTKKHLEACLQKNIDENLAMLANHALELPLHWRMLRLETRWFIDAYERSQDMNPILLNFAKLDYNMVQAKHQEDLKYASRYEQTCIFSSYYFRFRKFKYTYYHILIVFCLIWKLYI